MQGGDLAWSDEVKAALAVQNAVQQFQAGFSKNPKEVPMAKPPAWGYVEEAHEQENVALRRMKRHLGRTGRPDGQ